MCGIAGIFGAERAERRLVAILESQSHRGPDGTGLWSSPGGRAVLGHNRLAIIDLSDAGRQPMASADGSRQLSFNGEIYNYREIARELESRTAFRTRTDTEVLLAAYDAWGPACLDRFLGMFAFLLWDDRERTLWAVRDRFGVKPLYYATGSAGELVVASEIKAIHAAGIPREPDAGSWITHLATGASDFSDRTFWGGVSALPPGHGLSWKNGRTTVAPWYDLAERAADLDLRPAGEVEEEYRSLLSDAVALRFRSDVPVGINLSGGLDSSTLLGVVQEVRGEDDDVQAFTFTTGDPRYDETPWVRAMLERTRHPFVECRLEARDVPDLAASVAEFEDEPFGGIPTLAYARLFERARASGVTVLLDGQGMDEQWAGYDYYRGDAASPVVQGSRDLPVRADCLRPDARAILRSFAPPAPFPDRLRNLQYRDARFAKIPRALRFNDRASMRSSIELREPFLDHRLFELAFRQPPERKIAEGTGKWLLRKIVAPLLPAGVVEAPKRPVQTPQREWLRGELRPWAGAVIESALAGVAGEWLDPAAVRRAWSDYLRGESDNSFFVWQWIGIGLLSLGRESGATFRKAVSA